MSGFLHTQGHWTEAVTLGQAALAAARTAGDRHGQAWALHQLGVVQWLTGDYLAAAATLAGALELFRDLGHRRGQAWALHQLGVVQQAAGDYPGRGRHPGRGAGAVPRPEPPARPGLGSRRPGLGASAAGDYPAAAATLTSALELFRDLGDRHGQGYASMTTAWCNG